MNINKYFAEFLGTFTLAAAVTIAVGNGHLLVPAIAGLTLGLFVYTIGTVSGAHLNPAITIGLWSVKKIPTKTAFAYVVVQLLAGLTACWLVPLAFPVVNVVATVNGDGYSFLAELLGTGILAFGVASVVYGKVSAGHSGIVIGGSLTLGAILASQLSNGVLNPAVAIGLGSFSWVYALAPIAGSVVAFQLYRQLQK